MSVKMAKRVNPKRIAEFESIYDNGLGGEDYHEKTEKSVPSASRTNGTPLTLLEGFQEGATASPVADKPLSERTAYDMVKEKRDKFVDKINASKGSPSVADKVVKKITVDNVNTEIDSLLDSLDALESKDITTMFDFDISEDPTLNQMDNSDLDTQKVIAQVNTAVKQVTNIFRGVMHKSSLLARLGIKKRSPSCYRGMKI